MFLCKFARGVA